MKLIKLGTIVPFLIIILVLVLGLITGYGMSQQETIKKCNEFYLNNDNTNNNYDIDMGNIKESLEKERTNFTTNQTN